MNRRLALTPAERAKARGFCLGGTGFLAPIGSVGADYRSDCTTCGRRVSVTARGRFAHHKPAVRRSFSGEVKGVSCKG